MEFLRKLRWVLYPSIFFLVFLIGSYCSFPTGVLKEMAESTIARSVISAGSQNGSTPKVTIKDVSLWRLSGLSIKDLRLVWPAAKLETPLSFVFDSIEGRVGIFSLLTSDRKIYAQSELYEGTFASDVKVRKDGTFSSVNAQIEKISLAKMSFFESVLGAPFLGILDVLVNLDANTDLLKDGAGTIDIGLKQGIIGPGSIKLPAGGMISSLSLPKIGLGDLVVNLSLENGQLVSKTLKLSGGDLQAEINLTIDLNKRLGSSRINGGGWFSLKKEFIEANETIKVLYDLIPELKSAEQGDGRVNISLGGTLSRPSPKLGSGTFGAADQKNLRRQARN